MKVYIRHQQRSLDIEGSRSVLQLLRELGYSQETVLVLRNGGLVTPDVRLGDEDEVEIIPVITGG